MPSKINLATRARCMTDEERRLSDYYKPGAFGQRRRIGKSCLANPRRLALAEKHVEYRKKQEGNHPLENEEVFLRRRGILYLTPRP